MKKIYSYDNCEGDKGIIIADSLDGAIAMFKEQYPDRNVAVDVTHYWDNGSYIEEICVLCEENKLYVTCAW